MIKILILGTTGLLGSKVFEIFDKGLKRGKYKLYGTSRSANKDLIYFDALKKNTFKNIEKIKPDYIINCVGLLKSKLREEDLNDKINCLEINSILPLRLSLKFPSSKIIHISSNGIFEGSQGNYSENDPATCNDFYGKSKLLGEVYSRNVMNIRTSIVGFEKHKNRYPSLLNWFIENKSKTLFGYTNHYWNGITNLSLSKLLLALIINDLFNVQQLNISSKKIITKFDLLNLFNRKLNNGKTKILSKRSKKSSNNTLSSNHKKLLSKLWKLAGYKSQPSINTLINELVQKE